MTSQKQCIGRMDRRLSLVTSILKLVVRQDQGQVKVMGEEVRAVDLHHGEQADDAHPAHGEGDEAPVQEVSPVK